MNTHTSLGAAIRYVREGLSLNQPDFARKFGCSWATVSRWETDKVVPRSWAHRRTLIRLGVPAHLFPAASTRGARVEKAAAGPVVAA